jgi:hypothetical protein
MSERIILTTALNPILDSNRKLAHLLKQQEVRHTPKLNTIKRGRQETVLLKAGDLPKTAVTILINASLSPVKRS